MMDLLENLQIPARVRISSGNPTKNEEKENTTTCRNGTQAKSSKLHRGATRKTGTNLEIPPKRRILSDTAVFSSNNKKESVMPQSEMDKNCKTPRIPLGILDKNITNTGSLKQAKLIPPSNISNHSKQPKLTSKDTSISNLIVPNDTKLKAYEIHQPCEIIKQNTTARTNSTSFLKAKILETDQLFEFCSIQTAYPKTSLEQDYGNLNKTFVDSSKPIERKFYQQECPCSNLKNTGYMSPITAHMLIPKSIVIFQGIPEGIKQPAKKRTLLHKKHLRSIDVHSEMYCPGLDTYNAEYLEDILHYQLKNDWKYTVEINRLELYIRNRAAVVNWLIQAQDYLQLPSQVLFTAIRLFDKVLESTSVSSNMCQLVGLVAMWITNKFEDNTNVLTASKILVLCNGTYSVQDILQMEKKLLKFFNFDLNISDVTIYIAIYLKKLSIESDLLLHCTFYILECFALNPKFSTVIPSMQAAAAVRLAISIFQPLSRTWQQLERTVEYYEERELEGIMQEMLQQLHRVQDPAYEFRRPYQKYAENDKVQVSIVLLRELVAT